MKGIFKKFSRNDYNAVCDFLVAINKDDKTRINWNWARFEWMFEHPECDQSLLTEIGLWWDKNQVVGAAIFDQYFGEAFIGNLKGYEEQAEEVLDYAVNHLRDDNGLGIAINDNDDVMIRLLVSKGFEISEQTETILKIELGKDFMYDLKEGYELRPVKLPEDSYQYQLLFWKGFNHGDEGEEFEKTLINKVPFQPHLNQNLRLSVVDKKGAFCAHCNCWFIEGTDYAYVEPVCTIPECRGKGFAKAVIYETLNRCRKLGAKEAYVISDMDFYKKLGFTQKESYTFYWKK